MRKWERWFTTVLQAQMAALLERLQPLVKMCVTQRKAGFKHVMLLRCLMMWKRKRMASYWHGSMSSFLLSGSSLPELDCWPQTLHICHSTLPTLTKPWTIDWPLQMQQTDLYQHLTTYKEQYGPGLVIQIYFNNVTCDTEEVVFLQTVPSVSIANHQRSAQIFKRKPALQTGGVESKDVDVYQEGCIMGSVGSRG